MKPIHRLSYLDKTHASCTAGTWLKADTFFMIHTNCWDVLTSGVSLQAALIRLLLDIKWAISQRSILPIPVINSCQLASMMPFSKFPQLLSLWIVKFLQSIMQIVHANWELAVSLDPTTTKKINISRKLLWNFITHFFATSLFFDTLFYIVITTGSMF